MAGPSTHATKLLGALSGLEIGGSSHNAFGLTTRNVDFTDRMDTVYKLEEIRIMGFGMPVDIVADGAHLPLPDKSEDFIVSSHVFEHFHDPIAVLHEWARVARQYVYMIVPQRDALDSDRDLPLSTPDELYARHAAHEQCTCGDHHCTRWTSATLAAFCQELGYTVADILDPDDKVGNGFTIVLSLQPPTP